MPCGMCARRSSELDIVVTQLREATARVAQLEAELRNAHECIHHVSQSVMEMSQVGGVVDNSTSAADSVDRRDSRIDASFRASAAFPFRYVPPVDFLPESFVDANAELLAVIDGFAQVFHRHHVGGTRSNVNHAERENTFLRSKVGLLEAQLRSLKQQHQGAAATRPAADVPLPRRGQRAFPSDSSNNSSDADADLTTAPSSPVQRRAQLEAEALRRQKIEQAHRFDEDPTAQKERRLNEWRIRRAEAHRREAEQRPRELVRPPAVSESWQALMHE